jgi:hypothetical protein
MAKTRQQPSQSATRSGLNTGRRAKEKLKTNIPDNKTCRHVKSAMISKTGKLGTEVPAKGQMTLSGNKVAEAKNLKQSQIRAMRSSMSIIKPDYATSLMSNYTITPDLKLGRPTVIGELKNVDIDAMLRDDFKKNSINPIIIPQLSLVREDGVTKCHVSHDKFSVVTIAGKAGITKTSSDLSTQASSIRERKEKWEKHKAEQEEARRREELLNKLDAEQDPARANKIRHRLSIDTKFKNDFVEYYLAKNRVGKEVLHEYPGNFKRKTSTPLAFHIRGNEVIMLRYNFDMNVYPCTNKALYMINYNTTTFKTLDLNCSYYRLPDDTPLFREGVPSTYYTFTYLYSRSSKNGTVIYFTAPLNLCSFYMMENLQDYALLQEAINTVPFVILFSDRFGECESVIKYVNKIVDTMKSHIFMEGISDSELIDIDGCIDDSARGGESMFVCAVDNPVFKCTSAEQYTISLIYRDLKGRSILLRYFEDYAKYLIPVVMKSRRRYARLKDYYNNGILELVEELIKSHSDHIVKILAVMCVVVIEQPTDIYRAILFKNLYGSLELENPAIPVKSLADFRFLENIIDVLEERLCITKSTRIANDTSYHRRRIFENSNVRRLSCGTYYRNIRLDNTVVPVDEDIMDDIRARLKRRRSLRHNESKDTDTIQSNSSMTPAKKIKLDLDLETPRYTINYRATVAIKDLNEYGSVYGYLNQYIRPGNIKKTNWKTSVGVDMLFKYSSFDSKFYIRNLLKNLMKVEQRGYNNELMTRKRSYVLGEIRHFCQMVKKYKCAFLFNKRHYKKSDKYKYIPKGKATQDILYDTNYICKHHIKNPIVPGDKGLKYICDYLISKFMVLLNFMYYGLVARDDDIPGYLVMEGTGTKSGECYETDNLRKFLQMAYRNDGQLIDYMMSDKEFIMKKNPDIIQLLEVESVAKTLEMFEGVFRLDYFNLMLGFHYPKKKGSSYKSEGLYKYLLLLRIHNKLAVSARKCTSFIEHLKLQGTDLRFIMDKDDLKALNSLHKAYIESGIHLKDYYTLDSEIDEVRSLADLSGVLYWENPINPIRYKYSELTELERAELIKEHHGRVAKRVDWDQYYLKLIQDLNLNKQF